MIVKFKKLLPSAVTPKQSREDDACWDLVAVTRRRTPLFIEYDTAIAMEIPEDHVGLVFARSSVTNKKVMLKNSVGIIDPNYRGSVTARFQPTAEDADTEYLPGDRILQMMIIPRPFLEWQEVEELSDSERGTGGYGSSGS